MTDERKAAYRESVSDVFEAGPVETDGPLDERTPTPWVAEPNAYGTWFIYRAKTTETAPTGMKYRQLVNGGDGYRTLTSANAAFIVEAVNNYESLRAQLAIKTKALEKARECLEDRRAIDPAIKIIDAALSPEKPGDAS